MARCYKNGRAKALLFVAILFRYLIYTFLIFQEFYPLYNRIITKMRSDREKEGGKKMYGNYNTGYGMNPYQQQLAQNRLNQMEQQYNVGTYQPNNYQMQNNQQMGTMQVLKGRPVSSYDEAKASMIDLDGTLFVFTDIANNCIYTKQILLDGSAELKTYVLQEQKQGETKRDNRNNTQYVLREDFERTIGELNRQIEGLKEVMPYDATDGKPNVKK